MRPVHVSRVTQPFADPGSYASDRDRHGARGHHTGIDFGSRWPIPIAGRVVRSVTPGECVISEYNTTMGHWVGVYYAERNLLVTYWHLAGRNVRVGDHVGLYQVVGRVGNTGNSTAAHLHVQVNHGRYFDYDGHVHPWKAIDLFTRKEGRAALRRRRKRR